MVASQVVSSHTNTYITQSGTVLRQNNLFFFFSSRSFVSQKAEAGAELRRGREEGRYVLRLGGSGAVYVHKYSGSSGSVTGI